MIAGSPHSQELCLCGLKTNNRKFYRILSLTEVSELPLVLFVGAIGLCLVYFFFKSLTLSCGSFFNLCKVLPLHHPDKGPGFVFSSFEFTDRGRSSPFPVIIFVLKEEK